MKQPEAVEQGRAGYNRGQQGRAGWRYAGQGRAAGLAVAVHARRV